MGDDMMLGSHSARKHQVRKQNRGSVLVASILREIVSTHSGKVSSQTGPLSYAPTPSPPDSALDDGTTLRFTLGLSVALPFLGLGFCLHLSSRLMWFCAHGRVRGIYVPCQGPCPAVSLTYCACLPGVFVINQFGILAHSPSTFALCGILILAVAIWIRVSKDGQEILSSGDSATNPYVAVNILIAVGAIIMILGFLGCCGAMKESRCMLLLVSSPDKPQLLLQRPGDHLPPPSPVTGLTKTDGTLTRTSVQRVRWWKLGFAGV
ncbi:hypothetical protein HPG69_014864 [Diceros bicornis minor]|uniref:Uncharacterized protein n=1 Tax=Diceros bicornis minor TaxID=77932 RepID=A0A7J7FJQ4_DICBM|nr:hypothetical protein HPG69_014864 [Diceros bicornis minor]